MGRDKAALPLLGVAAATRIARLLDALFDDVLLVGGAPPDDAPGRRVADPADAPACPLRGLVAALGAARGERVLVVATDLPLLGAELALGLVAWPSAPAVAPRRAAVAEPLCALYRVADVLPVARERLASGRLSLQGLLEAVGAGYVEGADLAALDPAGHALHNVNTPEDLARAEALLAAPKR
jgi:molybdopterin-guanine dinucleotide biosynthesis protein A